VLGGQAVLEGVMMRSPHYYATSVRKGKKIVSMMERIKDKPKWTKIPFIRGVVNLIEMLYIGTKSLSWSAQQAEDEEESLSDWQIIGTLIVSFALAIVIFVALPYFLSILTGVSEESSPVLFNLTDGAIKIAILLLYLYFIAKMDDIKRVFEYHGAEHKAVFCYEAEKPLTVKNVKKFSRFHPRCGTSFLLMVALISIFFFSFIVPFVNAFFPSVLALPLLPRKTILFLLRIFVLPIVASFSYEFLKLSAKNVDNPVIKAVVQPGLWLQRLTTREPNSGQMEVAITSLQMVLKKDKTL